MSETNGKRVRKIPSREDVAAVRRQAALLEAQLRLSRLQGAQKVQQARSRKLRESIEAWDWIGGTVDFLDRFRSGQSGDFMFPISTAIDRAYGSFYPFWRTWQEHARIRGAARIITTINMMAAGALNGLTSFVIGHGYTYRAVPKPNVKQFDGLKGILAAVQAGIDQFSARNGWPELEQELFRRSRRDGEYFLRYYDQPDGILEVCPIEPTWVLEPPDVDREINSFGVYNERENLYKILGFWVTPDGMTANGEYVPCEEMDHLKVNVDRIVKRGLSDFSFDTYETFRRVSRLLENLEEGGAIQSAIAFIRQHQAATPDQVDDFASGQADYTQLNPATQNTENVQRFSAGTIMDIDGNQQYVAPPFASNTSGYVEIVQAGLRSVAVKWNAPEWLVSADASNNNMASSLVAESPFVRNCISAQQKYKSHFLRTIERAIRNWCEAGRCWSHGRRWTWQEIAQIVDVECQPPTVEVRDKNAEAQRNRTEIEAGFKSPQLAAQEAGYDWERVLRDKKEFADADITNPKGSALAELQGLGGINAVTQLQQQYYGGQLPREAAINILRVLINLDKDKAEALFPPIPPDGPKPADDGQGQGGPPGDGGDAPQDGQEGPQQAQQGGLPPELAQLLGESHRGRLERILHRIDTLGITEGRAQRLADLLTGNPIAVGRFCESKGAPDGQWLLETVLQEKGYTGRIKDKANRWRCYSNGKPVKCGDVKDEAGKSRADHAHEFAKSVDLGNVTEKHLAALHDHLAGMTVAEIKDLKQRLGVKTGANRKEDLIAKVKTLAFWTMGQKKRAEDAKNAPPEVEEPVAKGVDSINTMGMPHEDLKRLAGAPEGSKVSVSPDEDGKGAAIYFEDPDAKQRRYSGAVTVRQDGDKKVMKIESVDVRPDLQGKGTGREIAERMIAAAKELGIDRIDAGARRGEGLNGYYAWARYGFDAPLPFDRMLPLPDSLQGAKTVQDLMKTQEGRQWWKDNGTSVRMSLDLSGSKDEPEAKPADAAKPATEDNVRATILDTTKELLPAHSNGLVPIWKVRQAVREKYGEAAATGDKFDQMVLDLWRNGTADIIAISDPSKATRDQLRDAIPGHGNTLFYIELKQQSGGEDADRPAEPAAPKSLDDAWKGVAAFQGLPMRLGHLAGNATTTQKMDALANIDTQVVDPIYQHSQKGGSKLPTNEYLRAANKAVVAWEKSDKSPEDRHDALATLQKARDRITDKLLPVIRQMQGEGAKLTDSLGTPLNLKAVGDFYEQHGLGVIDALASQIREGGESRQSKYTDDAGTQQPAVKQDEQGFTGTDSLGRKWVNGELVAAQEEPAGEKQGSQQQSPKQSSDPIEDHRAAMTKMRNGELNAAEWKASFEQVASAEDAIKKQLAAKSMKELAPNGAGRLTKKQVVDSIYNSMLKRYIGGDSIAYNPISETLVDGIRRSLEGLTDDGIRERFAKQQQARTANQKAMTNPETYEEFSRYVDAKGEDSLTPDQKAKWDDLVATRRREMRKQQQAAASTVKAVDLGGAAMSLHQGWHDKHNREQWVVRLDSKVERDKYNELLDKAKKLGGYYSSFKGGKAIPGFQFKSKEDAERFMALQSGDVDQSGRLASREQERQQAATERLSDAADRLKAKSTEELGRDRLANTARRASHAAYAEENARRSMAFAGTLDNLAKAIESGEAKHLQGVRTRAQAQQLEQILQKAKYASMASRSKGSPQRYDPEQEKQLEAERASEPTPDHINAAVYPFPYMHKDLARDVVRSLANAPGYKQLAARLQKKLANVGENDWTVRFSTPDEIEDFRNIVSAGEKSGLSRYALSDIKDNLDDYNRVRSMGIETLPELRAALREYLPLRDQAKREDPVKKMERALIGKPIPGFFPTPPAVIASMIDHADIRPGMKVLEPSAGKGDILDELRETQPNADYDAVEPVGELRAILQAKGHNVAGSDFMQHGGEYDRVVMNPPFENGQDADHVRRAYEMLKPGGKLVAVMSEGPFSRSDRKAQEFRDWLDSTNNTVEKMQGAFAGPDAFRQTGVNTRMVVITKPGNTEG